MLDLVVHRYGPAHGLPWVTSVTACHLSPVTCHACGKRENSAGHYKSRCLPNSYTPLISLPSRPRPSRRPTTSRMKTQTALLAAISSILTFSTEIVHAHCYTSGAFMNDEAHALCHDTVPRMCDFIAGYFDGDEIKDRCWDAPNILTLKGVTMPGIMHSLQFRVENGQYLDAYVSHGDCVVYLQRECLCTFGGERTYWGGVTGDVSLGTEGL